ncbi:hypothetical protein LRP88_11520 [Fusarium phalaenopsidis]
MAARRNAELQWSVLRDQFSNSLFHFSHELDHLKSCGIKFPADRFPSTALMSSVVTLPGVGTLLTAWTHESADKALARELFSRCGDFLFEFVAKNGTGSGHQLRIDGLDNQGLCDRLGSEVGTMLCTVLPENEMKEIAEMVGR